MPPPRALSAKPKRGQRTRPPVAGGALASSGPLAPGGPSNVDGVDLPLPHERDQALGQVAAKPDPVIRQAKRDLDAGQVDTDMRATPGLDAGRRESLNPRTGSTTRAAKGRAIKRL